MTRKVFLLFVILTSAAPAQQVHLTARTDSTTFPLGSWIDVHVEGRLDAAVGSIAPAATDSLGPFEVLSMKRLGSDPQWHIRVTSIDSGKVFLPPIEFKYTVQGDSTVRTAFTNSILLNLTGASINLQGEIKDIKPPVRAPWLFADYLPYFIGVFILVLAAFGVEYYLNRKKRNRERLADVKVIIPPHREALTALRVLEEKKLWQQGKVKEYYSETTEIVRRFFEKRWNIIALEMTSEEILLQMKPVPEAQHVWKELDSFFLSADLVKFAKYQPSPAEHEQEMASAYKIIRAMVPSIPAVPNEQPQEAGTDVR